LEGLRKRTEKSLMITSLLDWIVAWRAMQSSLGSVHDYSGRFEFTWANLYNLCIYSATFRYAQNCAVTL